MAHVVANGEPKLAFDCIDGTEQIDNFSRRLNHNTGDDKQALIHLAGIVNSFEHVTRSAAYPLWSSGTAWPWWR
jgi:hypothetical protein